MKLSYQTLVWLSLRRSCKNTPQANPPVFCFLFEARGISVNCLCFPPLFLVVSHIVLVVEQPVDVFSRLRHKVKNIALSASQFIFPSYLNDG